MAPEVLAGPAEVLVDVRAGRRGRRGNVRCQNHSGITFLHDGFGHRRPVNDRRLRCCLERDTDAARLVTCARLGIGSRVEIISRCVA